MDRDLLHGPAAAEGESHAVAHPARASTSPAEGVSGCTLCSAARSGVLSSQVSYRARASCHVTTNPTGNNSARISYLQPAQGPGPTTTVEARDPGHVAAAVLWCLIGSDGHGAARVEDGEADIIVTALIRFDHQRQ